MKSKVPERPEQPEIHNGSYLLIISGTILFSMALIGMVLLGSFSENGEMESATLIAVNIEEGISGITVDIDENADDDSMQISREIGALMTPFPTNTPTPTNTPLPSSTPLPTETPLPTATIEVTAAPPPVISWTQEEKNALGWLCYGEVGGMAEKKVDACLSVLSTVRARYAYSNGFSETDVLGTLNRPGQFYATFYTDRPGPDDDLNWAVEQYQYGMRGSCNGYLYFDSVPGGPSLCQIYSSNGWVEFHNGWN